jgi:hypothetical protein
MEKNWKQTDKDPSKIPLYNKILFVGNKTSLLLKNYLQKRWAK